MDRNVAPVEIRGFDAFPLRMDDETYLRDRLKGRKSVLEIRSDDYPDEFDIWFDPLQPPSEMYPGIHLYFRLLGFSNQDVQRVRNLAGMDRNKKTIDSIKALEILNFFYNSSVEKRCKKKNGLTDLRGNNLHMGVSTLDPRSGEANSSYQFTYPSPPIEPCLFIAGADQSRFVTEEGIREDIITPDGRKYATCFTTQYTRDGRKTEFHYAVPIDVLLKGPKKSE